MKKFFKIFLWSLLTIIVLLGGLMWIFVYKITNGFPVSYETDVPEITFPDGKKSILLFSKSTGFRHSESIDASKKVFADMAAANNWFLYETEEGGVFKADQLAKFDAVIFNNSTGRVLNDEQQTALENYVDNGGSLIGIHGTGDNSHHWDWYNQKFLGAEFSHHPIKNHVQEARVIVNKVPDSLLIDGLPESWDHTDEWYVFLENPRNKGFNIVCNIDGTTIDPDGNMLWMKGKDFGMGEDHPVAWYAHVGQGRTFYTSMGHDENTWKDESFVKLLQNAIATK